MKRVDQALNELLRRWGISENIRVLKVAKMILKDYESKAVWFENGILLVWSQKAERRFEVSAKKTSIIRAINSLLGENLVKDIKFKRGI